METAYFKRHQKDKTFHFYKVSGGSGKTKDGYQEVINFLNATPMIFVEHNQPYDSSNPDKPFNLTGTWCTYEVGIPITRQEYGVLLANGQRITLRMAVALPLHNLARTHQHNISPNG